MIKAYDVDRKLNLSTETLKETVQKQQQLVWRARRSPNERRFELTDMSVALLRNEAPGEVR